MQIKNLSLLLVTILVFQCAAATSVQKKKKQVEKKQIVLFDGTSTDAWKSIDSDHFPDHGWNVEGGVLTVLGKTDQHEAGHDIITKKQFSNFELDLEVRLTEGANSGVKYMVINSYPGGKGQYLGLEYQLIDNERHPDALLGNFGNRKMAALYDLLPTRDDIKINPPGEWNKVKLIVKKNHVEHWINGTKAVVYNRNTDCFKQLVRLSKYNKLKNFGEQKQGHILLQGHGNDVSFRNIKITTW